MVDNVSGPGAKPPQAPGPEKAGKTPEYTKGESAFAKMLGPGATPEQVAEAMNNQLNAIMVDNKKNEAKAREAAKQMRKVIEGKE